MPIENDEYLKAFSESHSPDYMIEIAHGIEQSVYDDDEMTFFDSEA
jgi:hypothetical protein